jgi:hypothetical protein
MPERPVGVIEQPERSVYKATHPVLDYQGLRIDWTLRRPETAIKKQTNKEEAHA